MQLFLFCIAKFYQILSKLYSVYTVAQGPGANTAVTVAQGPGAGANTAVTIAQGPGAGANTDSLWPKNLELELILTHCGPRTWTWS